MADQMRIATTGLTLLQALAVEKGDTALVELLLHQKTFCLQSKRRALLVAVDRGHSCCVTKLLENEDASLVDTPCDDNTETLLYCAARNNHVSILDTLLNKSTRSINDINGSQMGTPLYAAAMNGHIACVEVLLNYRANAFKFKNGGRSPLAIASLLRFTDIVSLIKKATSKQLVTVGTAGSKAPTVLSVKQGAWTVFQAAANGHLEAIKALLTNVSQNKFRNHSGFTPLMVAALNGHADIVDHLISSGADVNYKCPNGYTALYLTVSNNQETCCGQLIAAGASVDTCTTAGLTALHAAVIRDSCRLYFPKLPFVSTKEYGTPLHLAVKLRSTSMINFISSCSFTFGVDSAGLTPLGMAIEANDPEMTRQVASVIPSMLTSDWCSTNVPTIVHSLEKRNKDIVDALFNASLATADSICNLWSDDEGNSVLHRVVKAEGSTLESVKLVLSHNSGKMYTKNKANETPIELAVKHNKREFLKFFLQQPTFDQRFFFNGLPFMPMVCTNVVADYLITITDALSKNEYPEYVSAEGRNALHYAASCIGPRTDATTMALIFAAFNWRQEYDFNLTDFEGKTPVDLLSQECQVIFREMSKKFSMRTRDIFTAISEGNLDDVKRYVDSGVDMHITWGTRKGQLFTPLQWALLTRRNLDLVEYLVKHPRTPWSDDTGAAILQLFEHSCAKEPVKCANSTKAIAMWRAHMRDILYDRSADASRVWMAKGVLERTKEPAMTPIMSLVGVHRAKRCALELFDGIRLDELRKVESRMMCNQTLNFVLLGNPGTGKTITAAAIADLLVSLKIRVNKIVRTTGRELVTGGVPGFLQLLPTFNPGVLVIDDVVALNPIAGGDGQAIVEYLMQAMERDRKQFTIIVTGGAEEVREKFLQFSNKLPSRFSHEILFDDMDQEQLRTVMVNTIRENKWLLDLEPSSSSNVERSLTDTATIAARRLARGSNAIGFANARSVRTYVERAVARASSRLQVQRETTEVAPSGTDLITLRRCDILGEPIDPTSSPLLKQLDKLTGLKEVKEAVRNLVHVSRENLKNEERGEHPLGMTLHRIFLGNPGTGKTTVAKIYGKILGMLGFLSKGEVEVVGASKLMGSYAGVTASLTNRTIDGARGKVLVIDEAYTLASSQYGKEVLDVLVERVQNTGSEDFAIILCGYEEEMKKMLRDCNPGLARRFRLDDAFRFKDFNDDELAEIMVRSGADQSLSISPELAKAAVAQVLSKQRDKPNFGNAGAVANLLQRCKESLQRRLEQGTLRKTDDGKYIVEADDLFEPVTPDSAFSSLRKLYGVEDIVARIDTLRKRALVAKRKGVSHHEILKHWLFVGPPGTGKTTVARTFGEVYHSLGLLSDVKVTEVKGVDLMGAFLGQTAPKVNDLMKQARGGVLFIDEAYSLIPSRHSAYANEALETMLGNITGEDYLGKIVIILAGYDGQMRELVASNPGLARRFTETLEFKPWTVESCVGLAKSIAAGRSVPFEDGCDALLHQGFQALHNLPSFGNAGDVVTLMDKVFEGLDGRCDDNGDVTGPLLQADVMSAFVDMVGQRDAIRTQMAKRKHDVFNEIPLALVADGLPPPNQRQEQEREQEQAKTPPTKRRIEQERENVTPNQDTLKISVFMADDGNNDDAVIVTVEQVISALARLIGSKDKREQCALLAPPSEPLITSLAKLLAVRVEKARKPILVGMSRLHDMLQSLILAEEADQRRLKEAANERERERVQQEIARKAKVQAHIRTMSLCVAGYEWLPQSDGSYRCAGGSHYISKEQADKIQ